VREGENRPGDAERHVAAGPEVSSTDYELVRDDGAASKAVVRA
jgi:hypothetical protein